MTTKLQRTLSERRILLSIETQRQRAHWDRLEGRRVDPEMTRVRLRMREILQGLQVLR